MTDAQTHRRFPRWFALVMTIPLTACDQTVVVHYSELAVCKTIAGSQLGPGNAPQAVFRLGAIDNLAPYAQPFGFGSGEIAFEGSHAFDSPPGTTPAPGFTVAPHTTRPAHNEKFVLTVDVADAGTADHILTYDVRPWERVIMAREPYPKRDYSFTECTAAHINSW